MRRTTDTQLLKEPNVGRKLLAELRRFCPPKTDETLERLFAKARALPPERKALVIDALTKICDVAGRSGTRFRIPSSVARRGAATCTSISGPTEIWSVRRLRRTT